LDIITGQVNTVTLSEAGRRLNGQSPEYVKGCCHAIGITLYRVGNAWSMSEEGFKRLAAHPHLHRPDVSVKKGRKTRKAVVSA
jgi:hypothetical protein